MPEEQLKDLLEQWVHKHNQPAFLDEDPLGIPHRFSKLQDIEITAFWTAMLAWGQRKTIINSANKLIACMDGAPYDFIVNHTEKDRARFEDFKHRTFQYTDTLYFLDFLQRHYQQHPSLEQAFSQFMQPDTEDVEPALRGFHTRFFDGPYAPDPTRKHIATPDRNSTCKRLNMFLRWMVRTDEQGVDFGLWRGISPAQLLIPLDVHVDRVARKLGLLHRKQSDWQAVKELTAQLRSFDAQDPCRYDFALFGIGVSNSLL